MKNLNPEVLGTTYGELVVDLTKTLLGHGFPQNQEEVVQIAGTAISLADQVVIQLQAREFEARKYAESTRVLLPVDWAPSAEDGPSRSGEHWSQPEIDALVAQFKNGQTGSQIATHHRRSWAAVSAQLEKFGLLHSTGRGAYQRTNGDIWEL